MGRGVELRDEGTLVDGRFRLLQQLSSTATAVVWHAVDERLRRPVSVKQLRLPADAPVTDVFEARARAIREGCATAALQHPHLIKVFDLVPDDRAPWLITEVVPSRSLATMLDERGRLDEREVARIGTQAAAALAAAHAAGIIHGDLNPATVLLDPDGSIKVTNLGISRPSDEGWPDRDDVVGHRLSYVAPELTREQAPTPASDVFALGVTLYVALEGESPFEPDGDVARLRAAADGQVRPPRRAGSLTEPVTAMLRRDPAARPSAVEIWRSLAAVTGVSMLAETSPTLLGCVPGEPRPRVPGRAAPLQVAPSVVDVAESVPPPRRDRSATGLAEPAGQLPPRPNSAVLVSVAACLIALVGLVLVPASDGEDGEPVGAAQPVLGAAPPVPPTTPSLGTDTGATSSPGQRRQPDHRGIISGIGLAATVPPSAMGGSDTGGTGGRDPGGATFEPGATSDPAAPDGASAVSAQDGSTPAAPTAAPSASRPSGDSASPGSGAEPPPEGVGPPEGTCPPEGIGPPEGTGPPKGSGPPEGGTGGLPAERDRLTRWSAAGG